MAPDKIEKNVSDRDSIQDILNFVDQEVKDHPLTPLDAATVTQLIRRIAAADADLMEVHKKIRAHNPADIADHTQTFNTLLKQASGLNSALHGIQANLPVTVPVPAAPQPSSIKLPQLNLTPFDGNLLEWISFRDMFQSAIHNNAAIPKIQKLTYLQSLLKGEAAKQTQSIILSDANYDIVWTQLNDRYQNDREILFAVLRKFYSQQNVQGSFTAIRALIDTSKECLRSLEILNLKADKSSEAMMLFTITTKLDQTSRELWEQSLKGTSVPPLKDLFDFLEQRARALAAGGHVKPRPHRHDDQHRRVHVHHGHTTNNCKACSEQYHSLYKCPKFICFTLPEKYEFCKKNHMCFNCLQEGHPSQKCTSLGRCKMCKGRHNTLLHKAAEPIQQTVNNQTSDSATPSTSDSQLTFHTHQGSALNPGMLATAIIMIQSSNGHLSPCRALIDPGSTATIITEQCCNRLGLRKTRNFAEVIGLAAAPVGTARGESSVAFSPRFKSENKYFVNALIMNKVTDNLPVYKCDTSSWTHLDGLILADPEYHKPAPIDILLGSDVAWSFISGGRRNGNAGAPLAIESTLGWLVAGRTNSPTAQVRVHFTDTDLNQRLQTFWELESVPHEITLTSEEAQCESHYAASHTRDSTGRFTVSIPWKQPKPALGNSRDIALRRLHQLERRLSKDESHRQQYVEFMKEYLALGHMSIVPESEVEKPLHPTCFIPHHFVLKEESTTTKFRVVFDASAKTTSGFSLNDSMMVGPALQDNLVDIVMRFRLNPIAFTADIAKMFRQLSVPAEDADLQRILWRESPAEPVKEYRLNTVTYGTASAPYLAVKTLQQLCHDEASSFPLAAAVASNDAFVDDIMSSCPSVPVALKVQEELLQLMNRGGLTLRKWSSNSEELINAIPEELRETKAHLDINMDPSIKALGLRWNTGRDQFEFEYSDSGSTSNSYTKRRVLSEMSKLFDPVGWLSPIIIKAKIFMQTLWKLTVDRQPIDWDKALPDDIDKT